jgi:hypothetical protein
MSRCEPLLRDGPGLSGLARARLLPLDECAENLYLRFAEASRIETMVHLWYQRAAGGLMSTESARKAGD